MWTTSFSRGGRGPGVFFVTRLKANADIARAESRPAPGRGRARSDEIVRMQPFAAGRHDLEDLRCVTVWLEDKQEELVLLANNFTLAASTIAALYKERWQIELFFKLLKQHLKIKTFVGATANAARIQIGTELIAVLVVRYLKPGRTSPPSSTSTRPRPSAIRCGPPSAVPTRRSRSSRRSSTPSTRRTAGARHPARAKPPKARVLSALQSVRGERLSCKPPGCNPLRLRFPDREFREGGFNPSVFARNDERARFADVARLFFAGVDARSRQEGWSGRRTLPRRWHADRGLGQPEKLCAQGRGRGAAGGPRRVCPATRRSASRETPLRLCFPD